MGAWGYGPMDNDGAHDFLLKIGANPPPSSIIKALKRALGRRPHPIAYEYARSAAKLVADCKVADAEAKDLALKALTRISEDDEWLKTWEKPSSVVASLKNEIRRVRAVKCG